MRGHSSRKANILVQKSDSTVCMYIYVYNELELSIKMKIIINVS